MDRMSEQPILPFKVCATLDKMLNFHGVLNKVTMTLRVNGPLLQRTIITLWSTLTKAFLIWLYNIPWMVSKKRNHSAPYNWASIDNKTSSVDYTIENSINKHYCLVTEVYGENLYSVFVRCRLDLCAMPKLFLGHPRCAETVLLPAHQHFFTFCVVVLQFIHKPEKYLRMFCVFGACTCLPVGNLYINKNSNNTHYCRDTVMCR